jgi:acyl carrier protein
MSPGLNTLAEVFRHVFEDDELTITHETTAADIEGWDSLMHVSLILAVEKTFGVRFSSSEVSSLMNVAMLMELINAKKGASRG